MFTYEQRNMISKGRTNFWYCFNLSYSYHNRFRPRHDDIIHRNILYILIGIYTFSASYPPIQKELKPVTGF